MGYQQDYVNAYANLVQRAADAKAQGILGRGQAWGNSLNTLAQIAATIPQQIQTRQKQAQELADLEEQRKLRGVQQQNYQSEIDARNADAARKKAEDQRSAEVLRIASGLDDGDPQTVQTALSQLDPSVREQVKTYLATHAESRMKQLKGAAQLAQSLNYDPTAVGMLAAIHSPRAWEAFNAQTKNGQDANAVKTLVDNMASLGDKKPDVKTREIQTVNPDGTTTTRIVEDKPGAEFTSAPKPKETRLESKQVMVDGRPSLANFDPATGKYYGADGTPITGKISPLLTAAERGIDPLASQLLPTSSNVTGDKAIEKLPAAVQMQVKALADGRMQFPSGQALKSPYWQNMLDAVAKYDPSFDAVNYNARAQTRKAFTSGKEAGMVNTLNTALGHLNELADASDALKNHDWKAFNTLGNFIATQTGSPVVTNFETIKSRVAPELVQAYRGAGGAEADIERNLKDFDAAASPAQLHGALKVTAELLQSKIDALQKQYDQGMGSSRISLLSDAGQKTLDRLQGKSGGGADVPAPVLAQGPGEHTFANGQTWVVSPDGKSAKRIK